MITSAISKIQNPASGFIIHAMEKKPTVAAISTPLGAGAIGIVRMTGLEAIAICSHVFQGKHRVEEAVSHSLCYGNIVNPDSGEAIDEVLVSVMKSPGTYTREDMVEVNCHGGPVAQQKILALLLDHGAELAPPGEFTRRAFLNGRIDLAQAESVAQIVSAKTDAALKVAMAQLEGSLSAEIKSLRQEILAVLGALEAGLDFSDEDIEDLDREEAGARLSQIKERMDELIESAFTGRILSHGVRTAIVGKPNVGKSSLLNALLMRDRAIVTEIPGTTRDTIEEIINVGGVPLKLIDTAGMAPASDVVEQIGVSRTHQAVSEADLILCLFDGSGREDDRDRALLTSLPPEKTIYVINKCDLFRGRLPLFNQGLLPSPPVIISAFTRQGLRELKEKISHLILGEALCLATSPIVVLERHQRLLASASKCLLKVEQGLRVGLGEEIISEEVRAALAALGEITGEEMMDDLLDVIFREFCVGK